MFDMVVLSKCSGDRWPNLMDLGVQYIPRNMHTVLLLCFVVVMQSFIMNSHEVFIHIHQGCFAGTGAIVRLPQCQWSKPDGYGKISQCITTTKQKPCAYFLGYTVFVWEIMGYKISESVSFIICSSIRLCLLMYPFSLFLYSWRLNLRKPIVCQIHLQ